LTLKPALQFQLESNYENHNRPTRKIIQYQLSSCRRCFLSIKGCRIGTKGDGTPFLAFPATKNEKTGKWWNHAWADEKFQNAILQMAKPLVKAPPKPAPKAPVGSTGSGFEDMPDSDIPFMDPMKRRGYHLAI
jgi:hypothetical protein